MARTPRNTSRLAQVYFGVNGQTKEVEQVREMLGGELCRWDAHREDNHFKPEKGAGAEGALKSYYGLVRWWNADPNDEAAKETAKAEAIAYAAELKAGHGNK